MTFTSSILAVEMNFQFKKYENPVLHQNSSNQNVSRLLRIYTNPSGFYLDVLVAL